MVPVCKSRHYIPPDARLGIVGVYPLSNGGVLCVTREGRRYIADMGRTGRIEMVPVRATEFMEKGGPIQFIFDVDWPWIDVRIGGLDEPRPVGALSTRLTNYPA